MRYSCLKRVSGEKGKLRDRSYFNFEDEQYERYGAGWRDAVDLNHTRVTSCEEALSRIKTRDDIRMRGVARHLKLA